MNNRLWRSFAARVGLGQTARHSPTGTREPARPLLDEATLRQLARMRIESGRSFTEWLGGERQGRRTTHALEFEDYRGYTAGDDFRIIDWNAYARLGDLFVKTSVAEEAMSIEFLIDCSRSMDWGTPIKVRYAEQLAAALGALALMHGDHVRVVGVGDGDAVPGASLHGPGDLTTLTTELEALPVRTATDFAGSIAAFQRVAEPHGAVVVLSDLLAPLDDIETLALLVTQGRDVFVIHIIDPAEAEPTLHGAVELRDRETGATTIRAITPAVRRQYMARFLERTETIAARLAAGNVRYIPASTAVAPIDAIRSELRRAGMVAPL